MCVCERERERAGSARISSIVAQKFRRSLQTFRDFARVILQVQVPECQSMFSNFQITVLEFSQNFEFSRTFAKKIGSKVGTCRLFLQMVYSVGVRRPWS